MSFEVTCPCCNAVLRIDAESQSVLQAKEPERKPLIDDLQVAVAGLRGEAARRDEAFQKSFASHLSSSRTREHKFDELLKLAKEDTSDTPPPRPFDLE